MLSNYSLSNNKQPLTFTTAADCGFNSKYVVFVICDLRIECQVDLTVFKALMSHAPPPL